MEYYEWEVILKPNLNGIKLKKNYNTTKESNRGPIYWQATAVPVNQMAIWWQGCKTLIISCTMLAYIYSAHAPYVIALVSTCIRRVPVRRFSATDHIGHNEVGSGGQFSPSVRPHNPATVFRPPSATVVSTEPFSHGTGTLRCLQKEMATYRHWSVSLWWDPDDVPYCPLTKLNGGLYRLHSADEDAVSWVTNYGSWHAYEKKNKHIGHRKKYCYLA